MDPAGREEILELARDLSHNKGMSLLFSSHLLPDVEAVCDYVVVIGGGKLLAEGKIQELKQVHSQSFDVRLKAECWLFARDCQSAGLHGEVQDERAPRAASGGAIAAVALGSSRPTSSSRFATCGRSAARWKKCFSKPWSKRNAHFRSRLSALVGRTCRGTPGAGWRSRGTACASG